MGLNSNRPICIVGAAIVVTIALIFIPSPWQIIFLYLGLLAGLIALILGLIKPKLIRMKGRRDVATTFAAIILYCYSGLAFSKVLQDGGRRVAAPSSPSPAVTISPSPSPSPVATAPVTPSTSPSTSPTPLKSPSPSPLLIKGEKIPIRSPSKEGCDCPYDKRGDGKECGTRSSYYGYTLGGGSRPICYFGNN